MISDWVTAVVLAAEGEFEAAREAADRVFSARGKFGLSFHSLKYALVTATEAAFDLAYLDAVSHYLCVIETSAPGEISPLLYSELARFTARLAGLESRSDDALSWVSRVATGTLRDIETPLHLAVVLLDHGEFLVSQNRASEAEPLISEAKVIFARLKARPWLQRAERAMLLENASQ